LTLRGSNPHPPQGKDHCLHRVAAYDCARAAFAADAADAAALSSEAAAMRSLGAEGSGATAAAIAAARGRVINAAPRRLSAGASEAGGC
jgi:hypothetical protein